jgi:ubiquinone biosynthesis protein
VASRGTIGARESVRLAQVYNTFLRYGLDIVFDRGRFGLGRRRLQYWLHDVHERPTHLATPTKARLMLQELGPTYVKVGQLVSSQSQILPDDWEAELTRLQQNVAPFSYDEVREIVTAELGRPPEELFDDFDPSPYAAASLGQVHRAGLDGQELVVKVQRPAIASKVRADLRIMRNLARFLEGQAAWAREVGLADVVDEFGKSVVEELDYHGEAFNARRLARNMEGLPGIHVPEIHSQLSTPKVLTMEYVRGTRITDVAAIRQAGLEAAELSRNVMRAAVKQLLVDGFFHGDPHPGNLLVDPETGVISLIDLGLCGELTLGQRFSLIQLVIVTRHRDVSGLAQVMRTLSRPFKRVDERAYMRDFERHVGRYLDPDVTVPMAGAVAASFDVLRDNGLRLDPELTLAIKALAQAEVIATTLRPAGGMAAEGYEIMQQLLVEQLTSGKVKEAVSERAQEVLRDLSLRVPLLQEEAAKRLESPLRRRLSIELDTSELNKRLDAIGRVSRQAIVALVLVGLLISSALVARVSLGQNGSDWDFLTGLAAFTFVGAVIGSAYFLFITLRGLARDRDQ